MKCPSACRFGWVLPVSRTAKNNPLVRDTHARALHHTSALLRYNARSLRHRYERAQFRIHFSIINQMISSAIWNK